MSLQQSPAITVERPAAQSESETRLHGRWLALAWVGWSILTLLSPSGAKLTGLKLGKDVDAARLDGPRLVLLRHSRIEAYDIASGRRMQIRRAVAGQDGGVTLEDAQDGLVVYTARLAVHVLRLSDGRDVVLGLKDEASTAHAQLVPAGLYYAYNQAWTRRPGRLGLVPMEEIHRALARRA